MSLTSRILYFSPEDRVTDYLLDQYRQKIVELSQQGILGKTLWLAPTQRIANQNRLSLFDQDLQVCFSAQIFTFAGFAETVLQQSAQKSQPLSDVNRRALLKLIIQDLTKSGKLKYFYPIAHTTGFLDIVGDFISELKRNETWPEDFLKACKEKGASDKDRELSLIYSEYQIHLNDLKLYDAEGRFWLAREILKQGENKHFQDLELVIVNGFTDFTFTQLEILEYLGKNSKQVEFTLPREPELKRDDLFNTVVETEQQLIKIPSFKNLVSVHFKHDSDTEKFRDHSERPAGIQAVSDCLFINPVNVKKKTNADGVCIYHTTGQTGEVELLASEVKQLLINGVSPDDIILSYRNVTQYSDLIQNVFQAAGIPVWVEAGKPLAQSPIIRALLQLLQLELEDWDFDLLMSVIRSNYFSPNWQEWNQAVPSALSEILRKRKLSDHRLTIMKSLERSVKYYSENDNRERAPGNLFDSYQFLKKMDQELKPLRRKMGFQKWIQTLFSLAESFGLEERLSTETENEFIRNLDQSDIKNWELFKRVFSDIGIFQESVLSKDDSLDLHEFYDELTDLLNSHMIPPDTSEQGKIRVLDAVQVRSFEVPYLFMAGLDEKSFPNHRRDDCLYNDHERSEFTEQGVTLGHRESRSHEEMILFYNAVTSATKRLSLSFPAIGNSGQPLYPSSYLTAIKDIFRSESLKTIVDGHLDPIENSKRLLNLSDFRLQASSQLLKIRNGSLFKTFVSEKENLDVAINLRAAVIMAAHRYQLTGLTQYEGVIEQASLKNIIQQKYNNEYQFSITQLEKYGFCPYQFFMESVLKIGDQASPVSETDHLSRGNLLHEVLAKLHDLLPHLGKEFLVSDEKDQSLLEEVTAQFLELSGNLLSQLRAETKLHQAFIHLEKQVIQDWATEYAQQLNEYYLLVREISSQHFETKYREVPFGEIRGDNSEEAEVNSCLVLGEGETLTNIRGKIDRIDVSKVDEKVVFNVVDYKSGPPPDTT